MTESVGELRDGVVDVGPSVYCFSLMVMYLALSCFSFYGVDHISIYKLGLVLKTCIFQ